MKIYLWLEVTITFGTVVKVPGVRKAENHCSSFIDEEAPAEKDGSVGEIWSPTLHSECRHQRLKEYPRTVRRTSQ